jgi:3-dehydroquinate synthase
MKLSGRTVTVDRTCIFCGDSLTLFHEFLKSMKGAISRIIILVDENTGRHCLPILREASPLTGDALVLEIPAGEASKSFITAMNVWEELLSSGADRKTLLINLGGGMITDLGGFIAAGYKRGISYINVPTTLIGQVDAAIGGKTGVNLNQIKNQVGFFYNPSAVFISTLFLETLPEPHLRSGMAEILKCGVAGDREIWKIIRKMPSSDWLTSYRKPLTELISRSVAFKNSIVRQDYREKGLRKILNFGHTVGHALESYSMGEGRIPLQHGEAVAAGMICESYLSFIRKGIDRVQLDEIRATIERIFPHVLFSETDIPVLISLMQHDKKNREGKIGFTLLNGIGAARINQSCDPSEITASLNFYLGEKPGT